jgi:hypothetical protein
VSKAARCHVRSGLARTQREVRIGAKEQKILANSIPPHPRHMLPGIPLSLCNRLDPLNSSQLSLGNTKRLIQFSESCAGVEIIKIRPTSLSMLSNTSSTSKRFAR